MNRKERESGLINNDNNLFWKKNKLLIKICKDRHVTDETSFHNLIYYYTNMSRKQFNEYENEIKPFEKSKICWHKAKEVKKYQNVFTGNLKKRNFKSEEQHKILKCFTIQETKLSSYMMFILQLHLRLNMKQFIEKKSKY